MYYGFVERRARLAYRATIIGWLIGRSVMMENTSRWSRGELISSAKE